MQLDQLRRLLCWRYLRCWDSTGSLRVWRIHVQRLWATGRVRREYLFYGRRFDACDGWRLT